MKAPEAQITIDPLIPEGRNWLHAQAIQGDVEARIDIRPYPDARFPGGYVLDQYYDRVNANAPGRMGRNQEERGRRLLDLLLNKVRDAMWQEGWRPYGKTPTDTPLWRYIGKEGIEKERQIDQTALHIWNGRYPTVGGAKVAIFAEFPIFRALITKRWYPVIGQGLEVCVDYSANQVQVRKVRKTGRPAKLPIATKVVEASAYKRTLTTRQVTFTCGWCNTTTTQERYPSPKPLYCSDVCKQEATREQTRERVRRHREKQRARAGS